MDALNYRNENPPTLSMTSKQFLSDISVNIPAQKTLSGQEKIQEFFGSETVTSQMTKNGELNLKSIQDIGVQAISAGNTQTLETAKFVEKNFLAIAGVHNDNWIMDEKVITLNDIQNLPVMESLLKNDESYPSYRDPRFSTKLELKSVAVGAAIGGLVQLGSMYVPKQYTAAIAVPVVAALSVSALGGGISGAVGGFIGGAALGTKIEGTREAITQFPLGIGGFFAGGYAGAMTGAYAWGPVLGGALGSYVASAHGNKLWNLQNRERYLSLFDDMKKL